MSTKFDFIPPDYLKVEVESSRPLYQKGTIQQMSPILNIGSSLFNMINITPANSPQYHYQTEIPVTQLPNYSSTNPSLWNEKINVSGNSFETMEVNCEGSFCGSKDQTFILYKNNFYNSLHKTVNEDFIAKLEVPQNAFASQSPFVSLSLEPANIILNTQSTLKNNSSIIEVNTNNVSFSKPSILQIPLNTAPKTSYEGLSLYRYNDQKYEWEMIKTSINYIDSVAIANILLPGKYSLMYSNSITRNIIVSVPNGGEEWEVGSKQTINWGSSGISNVKLEFSTNNGSSWNLITASTSALTGNYDWIVPNNVSSQCFVRISNAIDGSLYDISNNYFTIYQATNTTNWTSQTSGTSENLLAVYFINQNIGWAVGGNYGPNKNSTIVKTTNGGLTWIAQKSGTTTSLNDVFFLNGEIGWASGSNSDYATGGVILKTTNGGDEWITQFQRTSGCISSIYFNDFNNGWAAGEEGIILKTTDGGINWKTQPSPVSSGYGFEDIHFTDLNTGWIIPHYAQRVYKTTDGGQSWTTQNCPITSEWDYFFSSYFLDANTGWVCGRGTSTANVWYTVDGGITWDVSANIFGVFKSIHFINSKNGWVVGYSGNIYKTSDGGKNWYKQISNASNNLNSVVFIDSNHGWAVGDQGTILKLTTSSETAVEDSKSFITNSFSLAQNYPNPFNPSTTIEYSLIKKCKVTLIVYDVLGREIQKIVDEEKLPGIYQINFTAKGLASGIYFYRLCTSEFTKTKKFVLLK
jgi:photosystem II stability/assembly factor-like uncharacterized protein